MIQFFYHSVGWPTDRPTDRPRIKHTTHIKQLSVVGTHKHAHAHARTRTLHHIYMTSDVRDGKDNSDVPSGRQQWTTTLPPPRLDDANTNICPCATKTALLTTTMTMVVLPSSAVYGAGNSALPVLVGVLCLIYMLLLLHDSNDDDDDDDGGKGNNGRMVPVPISPGGSGGCCSFDSIQYIVCRSGSGSGSRDVLVINPTPGRTLTAAVAPPRGTAARRAAVYGTACARKKLTSVPRFADRMRGAEHLGLYSRRGMRAP